MYYTLTLPGDRRRPAHSRGFTLVYVAVALVMLFGFAALAIDVGRMELTHTQLQVAADAGARAAANAVIDKPNKKVAFTNRETHARTTARTVAAANVVTAEEPAGESVSLQLNSSNADSAGDIVFGRWGAATPGVLPTFTYLGPSDYATANAVKVVARRTGARGNALPMWFASIVWRDDADIKAEAIARISGGPISVGIVGIEWLKMHGVAQTNSYDYNVTPNPQEDDYGSEGDILSLGTIDIYGTPTVNGDATGEEITPKGSPTITGEQRYVWDDFTQEELVFPPVDASPYVTNNNNAALGSYLKSTTKDFELPSKVTFDMPAGTYYVHDLKINKNSTLNITGPVSIYVTGDIDINGNMTTLANAPWNLEINVAGDGDVKLNGTSAMHMKLYAPESDVTVTGTGDLFGAVIGSTLELGGTDDIHYEINSGFLIDRPWRVKLVK